MRSLSCVAVIVAAAGLCFARTAYADGAQIVVTGSGSVLVSPDRATINVSVTAVAATTKAATAQCAQKVKGVLDSLRQLGITDADIGTTAFAVQVEMDQKKGKPTGRFISQHRIRVRTQELNNVGPIVDAAVASGAEAGSIAFTVTEIDRARQQALAEAVTQAHADAEAMATAAGGKLGPLIELTTQGAARPPELEGIALKTKAINTQTTITPVDQYVNVTVLGRWEFREPKE
jgi:uncharacterized protein YggE